MINKRNCALAVTMFFLGSTASASEVKKAQESFENLTKCLKTVEIGSIELSGASAQQVLLLSVLKGIAEGNVPADNLGLNIDYSALFYKVKEQCPNEIAGVIALKQKRN